MKTCKNCGAQYSEEAWVYPNCKSAETANVNQFNGYAPNNQASAEQSKKKMNVFGLVGMIIGIVSCFISGYVGIAVSIVGLVFSSIGLKRKKECRLNGFAVAGLVLSIIALVYCILYVAILSSVLDSLFDLLKY